MQPYKEQSAETTTTIAMEHREIEDDCTYKGKKYSINDKIEDGCESICKCVSPDEPVVCEPRCPKNNHTVAMHEQCVTVPDPKDGCCKIELCDVTLDDHEQSTMAVVSTPSSPLNDINVNNNKKNATSSDTGIISATNEKYDCKHNGSKYKIGMHKEKVATISVYLRPLCAISVWLLSEIPLPYFLIIV